MSEPQSIETPAEGAPPSRLARLTRLSAAAILAERGLRVGAALATLALFFLTLSWLDLWAHVGPIARLVVVALFVQAGLYVLAREILRGAPSRAAALKRLDAEAGGLLPATSLEDHLASGARDPVTATLWEVHRRRLEAALGRIRIAPPRPLLAERDPFALRAFALVAAIAAAFIAGDERGARLRAAFDWRGVGFSGETLRLDAWLDPPPYTGRQPLVLEEKDVGQTIEAPVNSTLHVRLSGSAAVETGGALTPLPAPAEKPRTAEHEQQFKLTGAARLVLPDGSAFDFTALADQPPKASLIEPPQNNSRGSMTLSYKFEDDYGVTGAEALVARPNGPRTLYPPPKAPLALPAGRAGLGEARSTVDFGDSPWAGARAALTIVARDEAGNEGFSQPADILLPQRRFVKPLARALVEQRRNLALDPEQRFKVLAALEALSLAPEAFDTPSSIFLGLRAARRGLEGRRSDDELRGVVDLLWAMALSLENGDLSQAERDLRAAERDLREALSKGASPEEIARLTDQLREAMDKFLQGLAEQASRDQDKSAREPSGDGRALSEQDLKSMLDEMAKAGKAGDMAEAQKLLDDLQDMLENLQPSPGAAESARARDMQRALSELDRLTREQQQLRDETFRGIESDEALRASPDQGQPQGRGARPQGRPGAKDQGAAGARDRQQGLRERLERQRDALRKGGEESPGELDDADKAMKEAEQALGQPGGRRDAVDAQGRALQALRRGADQLASQMKGEGEEGAEGQGQGQGQNGHGGRGARAGRDGRDPLGRTAGRHRGYDNKSRYDPLGLPPAMRAHRVQEELRRRLGQPERPAEELDYLQRLLQK